MARIKVDRITADPRLQHRQDAKDYPGCANPELAAEYAEAMKSGAKFPTVKLVHDKANKAYWLYDGFHTLAAAVKTGKEAVEAEVSEGTFDDALKASWASNSEHGSPRKYGDKKNVLVSYYASGFKKNTAAKDVAKATKISEAHVKRIRADLEESGHFRSMSENKPEPSGDGAEDTPKEPQGNGGKEKRGRGRPPGPSGKGRRKAGKGKPQDNGQDAGEATGEPVKDKEGNPVPDDIAFIFRQGIVEGVMDQENSNRDAIKATEQWNPWLQHARLQALREELLSLEAAGIPYALCPACKGDGCERCRKAGWLPEAYYLDVSRELETASVE